MSEHRGGNRSPGDPGDRGEDLLSAVSVADRRAPRCGAGFYDTCAYQEQKRVKADVWFTAHETLFTRKPKVAGEVAAIVVDESPRSAGIRAATPLSMGALN